MIRTTARYLMPVMLAAASQAGEITMAPQSFTVERSFSATVMPEEGAILLQVEPKAWVDYRILELVPHGAAVAKGDVLVRFDGRELERKIADTRKAIETGVPTLAQTEADLKHLQETMPHQLQAMRIAADVAKEEHAYFTETRRKATEESAAQSLERRNQMLDNQQEELRQLTKMYDADALREETEEIILTRQKDSVASAEFAVRMETLEHDRTLKVTLPREATTLATQERDTAIALLKAEADLPRSITLKKLELEKLKTGHQREKETLADLEHDQSLLVTKAPADGRFYHGPIENGRWTPAEALKSLFKNGRPQPGRPFATFVPATVKPVLVAFLDEATARSLKAGLEGIATPAGREDAGFSVSLTRLSTTPEPDGTYRADFSATWPTESGPVTGATAQLRLVAYHKPDALVVPTKALAFGPQGWTVEVKLADGKTEHRAITRGRVSGETTEILSGLEAGQVVIAPDK